MPTSAMDDHAQRRGSRSAGDSRAGAYVAVLALASLGLRLVRLDGQSLWYDEAYSIAVSGLPFGALIEALVADVRQAPLHFVLLSGWMEAFGAGAAQARSLSVLASAGGVVCAWLFARRLFGARTAYLAAALLATSQLDVLYAQEARMYALFACLSTAGSWLFARAVLDGAPRALPFAAALAAGAVATHYYGVLIVAAWALFAFTVRRSHPVPIARWLGGALTFVALLAPWWILGAARQAGRVGLVVPERPASWFAVDATSVLRTLNELNGGRLPSLIEPSAWWAWLAGALLFSVPAFVAAVRARGEPGTRAAARLCVLLVVVPLALALLLGTVFRFQYATRYVLPCLVPYLALVAHGLLAIRARSLRTAAIVAALVFGGAGIATSLTSVHKVQWREALAYVVERRDAGDRCVFLPGGRPPLEWGVYHPDLDPRAATLASVVAEDAGSAVWLVAFERTPAQAEEILQTSRLLARAFVQTDELRLFRVVVLRFEPR